MAQILLFLLAGVVLGYILTVMASWSRAWAEQRVAASWVAVVFMGLRLLVFILVVGWLSRRFGPVAGLTSLVGTVLTRGWLLRARPASSENAGRTG